MMSYGWVAATSCDGADGGVPDARRRRRRWPAPRPVVPTMMRPFSIPTLDAGSGAANGRREGCRHGQRLRVLRDADRRRHRPGVGPSRRCFRACPIVPTVADVVRARAGPPAPRVWCNAWTCSPARAETVMEHLARDWPELVAELLELYSRPVSRPRHDGAGEEHRGRRSRRASRSPTAAPGAGYLGPRRAARASHLRRLSRVTLGARGA